MASFPVPLGRGGGMGNRSFAILIAAVVMTATSAAAQNLCDAAPAAVVPFDIENGRMLVDVRVNGRPARFAIDTGGFGSVIGTRLVESLKLPQHRFRGFNLPQDVGGSRATLGASVTSLFLGGRPLYNWLYAVADTPPGTDGLLANDVLRFYDLDFDFAGHRLALYPSLACAGRPPGTGAFSTAVIQTPAGPRAQQLPVFLLPAGTGAFSTVRIKSGGTQTPKILIPVLLDGKEMLAALDTGANHSYIAASQARESFGVALDPNAGRARGTFGGLIAVSPHDFDSLQIGDTVLARPRLYLMDQGRDDIPILLGLEQLQDLRLFVSLRAGRLYVSRPPHG
jgi:predicted aspartyl protease